MKQEWKFNVSGKITKNGKAVHHCEAIIETNIRDTGSPFQFKGVGPIAKSNLEGNFSSYFLTYGSNERIRTPQEIVAFVKVRPAKWEPVVVGLSSRSETFVSDNELSLTDLQICLPNSFQLSY